MIFTRHEIVVLLILLDMTCLKTYEANTKTSLANSIIGPAEDGIIASFPELI